MKTKSIKKASKTLSTNAKLQADLASAKAKKVTRRAAKVAPRAKAEEDSATVSGVAREMILSGKTNEQVLDALMELFPGFDVATKKHYPGWYRAELVRKGMLSKTAARATAH